MEIGSDIDDWPLVCTSFVDADWPTKQFDLVHDLDGVVCILLGLELAESVALMRLGDSVLWEVDTDHRADLEHELPNQRVCRLLIDAANIDCCILVSFVVWESGCHRHC